MKATLVIAFLCIIFLYCDASPSRFRQYMPRPYRGYSRNYNSYDLNRPRRVPGLTSDGQPCPVPNGCIQLPDNNDVMTRATFESQVVGVRQHVMYRINQPFLFRQEYVYNIEGNTVNAKVQGRINETACAYLDLMLGVFISTDDRAIFRSDGTDLNVYEGVENPQFFILSDNPSVYNLFLVCQKTASIRNGFCEGDYFVDIMLTQNPPNNPPFKKIEDELCRKLGLSMDDPSNNLIYRGEGCPTQ